MGAQGLKRAAEEDIRQVLGDGALRGGALREALARLGRLHGIEPLRAAARVLLRVDASEAEARGLLDSIEAHRLFLEERLGRDPGLLVAAVDSVLQADAPGVESPSNAPARHGPGAGAAVSRPDPCSIDDVLALELRRAERSGRPLAILLLGPEDSGAPDEETMAAAIPIVRDALRDTDQIARVLPEGLVAILPATTGPQALRTAERLRLRLAAASRAPWCAGVAACPDLARDAATLASGARDALRAARLEALPEAVACHPERRSRPRLRAAGWLAGAAQGGAARDDPAVRVEDLSIDGALLVTNERYEEGADVSLSLSQTSVRPRQAHVRVRVLRVDAESRRLGGPFRTAVRFSDGPDARRAIAALLADLRGAGVLP